MKREFSLRKIQTGDNEPVAKLILQVMTEFGAVGEGYSIMDPEVDQMYQAYNNTRSAFFVIEKEGTIYGCGGFGPLPDANENICELKKMYFLPDLRGLGFGRKLVEQIFESAQAIGYKQVYLETVERMSQANHLYQKMGFKKLSCSVGNTGHGSCEAYYIKDL